MGKTGYSAEGSKLKKHLLLALKIALGSSSAIYIAQLLNLQYATSAGTIALLTIMATKWETVKLSVYRVVTMCLTIAAAWLVFPRVSSLWVAYGIFIFLVVLILEYFGLRATVSVNSVIGAHLLTNHDFSIEFILNEVVLVLIGIVTAFLVNLFHDNKFRKKEIIRDMKYTEERLQMIMGELAAYLSDKAMQRNVWDDIISLEREIAVFTQKAYEYQDNTFQSHPAYFIDYFEMRQNQCHILHNLHYEMKKIRKIPKQAGIIAGYLLYLMDYIVEHNVPGEQMEKLEELFETMRKEELPKTREEFENRAILYHILMDIEEFLVFKQRFVKGLSETQKAQYW